MPIRPSPDFESGLARTLNDVGDMQRQAGQMDEALRSHEAARELFQGLADANPTVTAFRIGLASSHNQIGIVRSATGQPAEALRSYQWAWRSGSNWPTPTRPPSGSTATWPTATATSATSIATTVSRPRRCGRWNRAGHLSETWPRPIPQYRTSGAAWHSVTPTSASLSATPAALLRHCDRSSRPAFFGRRSAHRSE